MATEIVIALIGLLSASNVITFLLTKRKYITEVDSQQIKNVEDSFDIYKKIMNEAIQIQDNKISALQQENERLRNQVNQLQMQLISLVGNLHANPGIPTSTPTPEIIEGLKTNS